ncbi:Xaa-Pro aminopeptidase 2 [Halocaridina rubra]|uniref:Xaa-Pro aminopeptidase 2 n=1 Tax=Halocaridina rubra TaxID=373956 RepID=A0AAN8WSS7_HALRR
MVVPKKTKYTFDRSSLGFEAVSLVPFEAKLIDLSLLSPVQCHWLNDYHSKVRSIIGNELQNQGRHEAYKWLTEKTKPLSCHSHEVNEIPKTRKTVHMDKSHGSSEHVSREITESSSFSTKSSKGTTISKNVEYTTAVSNAADVEQASQASSSVKALSSLLVICIVAFTSLCCSLQ